MSEQQPLYTVGIDLGTTHCVLSYCKMPAEGEDAADAPDQQVLGIDQLVDPGVIESRSQLPSFVYLPHENELSPQDRAIPWNNDPGRVVGELARAMGSKTPIRLVSSAKSWLCHGGVDRRQAFLPLESPEEVEKLSPLQASVLYLEYLKQAWDQQHPEHPLAQQDLVVTIPASFDPAARELTAEAIHQAGLNATLLEEPQAAVYSWIEQHGEQWREHLQVGDVVLVVDIGGGTSDLSLIAVTESDGELQLNRIAVGDHILLGGDNMDLALAYRINAKLNAEGKQLQPWQIQAITHGCRHAKETLLADPEAEAVPIVVPSRGSKLLGSTLRTELTREEVEQTLVEGFFPQVGVNEHPQRQARGALTKMGLPYAQDAAITRHLAAFLSRHVDALQELEGFSQQGDFIQPTAILFNGGVLKAPQLSQRLLEVINGWLQSAGVEPARLLAGADLDLAVARGASYYSYARHGKGVRIRGGLASAYYVGIESAMPAVPGMPAPVQALCVAPFGMEEGSDAEVTDQEFGLVVGEPVRFRFFGSTTRRDDEVGALLDFWQPDELEELPEIQATLPTEGGEPGEVVPVTLATQVTEIGTLELEAVSRDREKRWKVELDVRGE